MPTDPVTVPSNWFEWVFGVLWFGLVTLVGVIYKRSNQDRIDMQEDIDTKASKEDLEASQINPADIVYRSDYEQNRREVRQDMNEIHKKLDRVIVDVHNGQTNIMAALAGIKNGIK